MRIWSLHPEQLDRAALVSGWREGLLAQKVLRGLTKGYRHHPQLARWRELDDPVAGIAAYLHVLADEADRRGYRFDRTRLVADDSLARALLAEGGWLRAVTTGQLHHEWEHLAAKVELRAPDRLGALRAEGPRAHPLLEVVEGPVAPWEVVHP